jgi:hypothetical protein
MGVPLIVALLSSTLVALEVCWTRVFAAEYFYTFAFLIVSLAVLGLGLGALGARLWRRLRRPRSHPWLLLLTGLVAVAAPPVVLRLGLDFTALPGSAVAWMKLVAVVLLLGAPYLLGGAVLAAVFRGSVRRMPRLYMADLLGAAGGGILALLLMNTVQVPRATLLAALPALLAAAIAGRIGGSRRSVGFATAGAVGLLALLPIAWDLLAPPREERAPVLRQHWDAMGRVKVLGWSEEARGFNIDNAANSPILRFDGDFDVPDSVRTGFGIPVHDLIARFDSCTFLSLGAGGGSDVLQALFNGCTEVHAVEVNPAVIRMMRSGELAEFSGRIYHDPRVTVAVEDGRAYVRRFRDHFDIIYSLSSNTFAALASGSFALAEDYLFTTEAFEDYWRALSPDGFLVMEHQFYMPRLVSEVMEALEAGGVERPEEHFCVYALPRMRRQLLLLSRRPLTEEIRQNAIRPLSPEIHEDIHLLFPAADSLAQNVVNQVVLHGWRAAQDSSRVDLSPCDDDRPFTAQLGRWRNLGGVMEKGLVPYEFLGFPASRLILVSILVVVLFLAVPPLFLPLRSTGPRLTGRGAAYFALLGAAFMMVEVVLLQRWTLFAGASTWTFTTILVALLVGAGIGSRCAVRFPDSWPFLGAVLWLLLELGPLPAFRGALFHLGQGARLAWAAGLLLPLGFCLGMPFPKGALRVGEAVDWGFAVNGVASVVGSVTALLVAFRFGMPAALLAAAGLYATAGFLLPRLGWTAR